MRTKRHNAILSIIKENFIETQQELSDKLSEMGFEITQATVSRDIKELRLIKAQAGDGRSRYVRAGSSGVADSSSRIRTIFSHSVLSVDYALNNVVIKTLSGMAQAAAITLESMAWPEILGTVGGDDTVLVVVRSEKDAAKLTKCLKNMIEKE